jgi:hypothetical protein
MLVFILKIHLDPLGFIHSSESTKFQTWLVHEIHSFKSFLGINIIYYFQVIGKLINYEHHVFHNFHERFLYHWCITSDQIYKDYVFLKVQAKHSMFKPYLSLKNMFHLDIVF